MGDPGVERIFGGTGSGTRGIAALAATSVAAGFGVALGEDAYRAARRWWRPLPGLAALAGTAWVGFDLVRGHRRTLARHLWLTVGLNAAMVATSFAVVGWLLPDRVSEVETALGVAGALAGALVRPRRLRAFAVADHNEAFLRRHGFVALGGRMGTVRDGAGRELVPYDHRLDALVFDVVEEEGRRARIHLDGSGRMTRYDAGAAPMVRGPDDGARTPTLRLVR